MSEQTEFFILITVEKPTATGMVQGTFEGVVTPEQAGRTRAEMFRWMRSQLPERFADASTVFFTAEPNQLVGGAA